MAHIGIITGDLIGSTKVAQPAAFRKRLQELLTLVQEQFRAHAHMFRGDGFQVTVDAQVNAFRLAILLRSGLISHCIDRDDRWDTRIAIAFGPGQLSAADQNSDVHVNSGRMLDSMDKDHLRVYADDKHMILATRSATAFADDILDQLTPTEAEVLFYHLLERGSHQDIADRLDKKRPTITMALQRARYHLLDRYIQDMDELVRLFHE